MIPKFYETMYPILEFLSDEKEHKTTEIYDYIAKYFKLSDEEKNLSVKTGQKTYIKNTGWGISYLKKNNYSDLSKPLIENLSRGVYKITKVGKKYFENRDEFYKYLKNTFIKEFKNINFENKTKNDDENEEALPPLDKVERIMEILKNKVKSDLLEKILNNEPRFFENLILELFKKMGYAYEDRAELTNKGADGGIDGIIYEDELGLSKIYTQAKRYQESNNIGRPKIQEFAGMISEHKVTKGIFVTTSDFTPDALNSAKKHENIILINGDKLLDLMIKFKVGVSVRETYEILEIDQNFFDDEDI